MKCAIYCRVSSEEQKLHGISIDAQLDELRKYAQVNHYAIYDEYVDAGFSGGLLHRPALDKLLSDATDHCFQVVLFVKLDRWFRSVSHYYKIQEVLDSNNINWIATQENYETVSSSGKFKVNIMLSVSQQFKDATSERVKSVFNYKLAVTKEVRSGSVPYGYSIVNKHYVVNEEQASHIRGLFTYALMCKSFRECHRWWVSLGYDNVGYKTIRERLIDKRYIGIYEFGGIEYTDYYPAIVSETVFYQVADLVNSKRTRKINSYHDYLFSGLVYCSECDSRLAGNCNSNGMLMYRCNRSRNGTCSCGSISESKIEQYVLNVLPLKVANAYTEYDRVVEPIVDNSSTIRSKQLRLKELYVEGLIDKPEFTRKYSELESQIIKSKPVTRNENLDLLLDGSYLDLYNKLDRVHKNLFFRECIDRIVVRPDKTFSLELKVC